MTTMSYEKLEIEAVARLAAVECIRCSGDGYEDIFASEHAPLTIEDLPGSPSPDKVSLL